MDKSFLLPETLVVCPRGHLEHSVHVTVVTNALPAKRSSSLKVESANIDETMWCVETTNNNESIWWVTNNDESVWWVTNNDESKWLVTNNDESIGWVTNNDESIWWVTNNDESIWCAEETHNDKSIWCATDKDESIGWAYIETLCVLRDVKNSKYRVIRLRRNYIQFGYLVSSALQWTIGSAILMRETSSSCSP